MLTVESNDNLYPNTSTFPDKIFFDLCFTYSEKEIYELEIEFTCCFVSLEEIKKVFEGNIDKTITWFLRNLLKDDGSLKITSDICTLHFCVDETRGFHYEEIATVKCVFSTDQMIAAIRREFEGHPDFQDLGKLQNIKKACDQKFRFYL